MNTLRRTVTVSVLASLVLAGLASPARAADPAPKTSLVNLVDEGHRWFFAAAAGPTVASDPTAHTTTDATAERATAPAAAAEQPFVDFSPNASLIARDWRGSLRIIGSRSMLVDDLRPTASNRMVMGRLATDARLSLFTQVGVGEWRIDPVMFPNAASYSELAGQVGVGFEMRITPRLRLAGEMQYTVLYHDLHYTTAEVAPHQAAAVLALAGAF